MRITIEADLELDASDDEGLAEVHETVDMINEEELLEIAGWQLTRVHVTVGKP